MEKKEGSRKILSSQKKGENDIKHGGNRTCICAICGNEYDVGGRINIPWCNECFGVIPTSVDKRV